MVIRRHLLLWPLVVALLFAISCFSKKNKPTTKTLVIYANASFASAWGPGPKLIQRFEALCNCQVQLNETGDFPIFIQKLKNNLAADLVIGFDQLSKKKMATETKWRQLPKLEQFIPYDWAPMTMIYRKSETKNPPHSLDDLLSPRFKNAIALQDPRSSTPGLQFLVWVYKEKGSEFQKYLKALQPNVHSLSPTWGTAYGLFKKKQAKLVFSYFTSPVYHIKEEKNFDYTAARFKQRHPIQVEYLGVLESCNSCDIAEQFAHFVLTEESQSTIMNLNYMLPILSSAKKGAGFDEIPKVDMLSMSDYDNLNIEELISQWKEIFH